VVNVRSITFIDNPWGDQGVVLQVPLVVTHLAAQHAFSFNDFRTTTKTHGAGAVPFKNKKSSTDETSVGNFTHWGDTPVIKSLLDKTQTQQRIGHLVQQKRGPFYINLSRITGDGWNIATYYDGVERKITNVLSVVGRIWEKVTTEPGFAKGGTGNEMLWISFETELEAQNFLAYVTKNKLIKALCAIYKIDQNVEGVLDVLPMLDQNVEWTDAKTYEYFDFSAAEILAIEQIVEMIDVNSYK
jgi:hypothetical protein